MNEQQRPDDDQESTGRRAETRTPGFETGKSRPAYLDPGGSQSTKELRETARRRRAAEEKLQQHLMEAKEHAHQEPDRQSDAGEDDPRGKDDRAGNPK